MNPPSTAGVGPSTPPIRHLPSGRHEARTSIRRMAILVATLLLPAIVIACGLYFPSSLLLSGDDAVLQAPMVHFTKELERLQLEPPPRLSPSLKTGTDREVTLDSEILDLRRALAARGLDTNEVAGVVLAFSRSRADIEDHRRALGDWETPSEEIPWLHRTPKVGETNDPPARPELSFSEPPSGLPREFAIYLRGAADWHDRRTNEARKAWSELLALPVGERPYKTTWATFMLGRSWHDSDPVKATKYYEQTRQLARASFSDSAGLAIAALGWQGQLSLRTNDLAGALRLYLDQYAAGAHPAEHSLAFTVARITKAPDEQRLAIAQNPLFRRVVTGWILSSYSPHSTSSDEPGEVDSAAAAARAWLDTIEATGAAEVPLAEQLAVLAYQSGDYPAAQRWVELSGDSAVATWIHAKLLLRDGKLAASTAELARVVEHFPIDPPTRVHGEPPAFIDSFGSFYTDFSGRAEALGELGALRIARGEFAQSLDALLRAGYWQDASYVAERVLTASELKTYVDAHWPALTGRSAVAEAVPDPNEHTLCGQRERIRYLLARRLNRERRGPEAVHYFPARWKPAQTRFLASLKRGADKESAAPDRARAWFEAAWIARTNGLEILGTEAGPDWAIWDADYEGPDLTLRTNSATAKILKATPSEIRRAAAHHAQPEERFHYRYAAARLAWEAAQLLPNNDPETASVLWTAGRWLQYRDPETADIFYKSLVRRCSKTELGSAADRQRWFPELDENGHPVVTRKATPTIAPDPQPADKEE